MNFPGLHDFLSRGELIHYMIEMLKINDNPLIVKALAAAIQEASRITLFYPDLLSEAALSVILHKIITPPSQPRSLELLFESLKNIML